MEVSRAEKEEQIKRRDHRRGGATRVTAAPHFPHLPSGSRWLTGLGKIGTGALETWNVLYGGGRGGGDDRGRQ